MLHVYIVIAEFTFYDEPLLLDRHECVKYFDVNINATTGRIRSADTPADVELHLQ